jgi:hypothetical protein
MERLYAGKWRHALHSLRQTVVAAQASFEEKQPNNGQGLCWQLVEIMKRKLIFRYRSKFGSVYLAEACYTGENGRGQYSCIITIAKEAGSYLGDANGRHTSARQANRKRH